MTALPLANDPTIPPPTPAAEATASRSALEPGIACCLSGGYRAMLFHVGSLWRLNEAGLLPSLKCVSSGSEGSITATVLGANWKALDFGDDQVERGFVPAVVAPLRAFARHTIDWLAGVGGGLNPFGASSPSKGNAPINATRSSHPSTANWPSRRQLTTRF